jgi:hypothetical protein
MPLGRRLIVGIALLGFYADKTWAVDWQFDLDARLVSSDAQDSAADAGLRSVRFDSKESGLQLGRARLALDQDLGQTWTIHLDASAWGDDPHDPIDMTEAYAQWRPYPFEGYRFRLRAGAFYSPISLENRASGWESPYTLSYSAINTWLGQELRTIGVEGQLDWLGTRSGHDIDLSMVGGVFGWDDPAGTVLATRGFSLNDRQTPLFGHVGSPVTTVIGTTEPFHEIDHQPGYYGGLEARYFDRVTVRALRYDNRADPASYDGSLHEFAWSTHFYAAGARAELQSGWSAIVQWLEGETYVAPDGVEVEWPFRARFALISKTIGRHRLSFRYDTFDVEGAGPVDKGAQNGHALTAAYVYEASEHWRFMLEWLEVFTHSADRALLSDQPPFARENQLQLAAKYSLRSTAL